MAEKQGSFLPTSTFWVFAGVALLIVSGAFAYHVVNGGSGKFSIDKDGVVLEIEKARQELAKASADIQEAQTQLNAQSEQLQGASRELADKEVRLNSLVATLERQAAAPSVPSQVRADLAAIASVRPNVALRAMPTESLARIDERIRNVEAIKGQLQRQ